MALQKYNNSLSVLLKPSSVDPFLPAKMNWKEGNSFSYEQAWTMSVFAHLAYYREEALKLHLSKMACELKGFYNAKGNHAFIAQHKDNLILSFRGTEVDIRNYYTDINFVLTDFEGAKVHKGFLSAFNSLWPKLEAQIKSLNYSKLYITGHSLGAALALLSGTQVDADIYTFGAPKTGNETFVEKFNGSPVYRIVNADDPIPSLPPSLLSFRHAGNYIQLGERSKALALQFKDHSPINYSIALSNHITNS